MDFVTADAASSAASGAASPLPLDALATAVREALAATYALPIVIAQPDHDRVAVVGAKPLAIAREAVAAVATAADADRIVELDPATLPWRAVPASGLRLWRQHGRSEATGELVTELQAGDPPVQVVTTEAGWQLVRTADGAQGWLAPDAPTLDPTDAPPAELHHTNAVDLDSLVDAALAHLDAPYVWGGTTAAGVDCSGLVQRAAWSARGGCWLPRHSRALLTVGTRVAPSNVERGDVLVLKRDPKTYEAEQRAQLEAQAERQRATGVPAHGPAIHPMHVAIALSATEVLHASRDAMRVVREPLASLRERYRVLGVRRLGPAAAGEVSNESHSSTTKDSTP